MSSKPGRVSGSANKLCPKMASTSARPRRGAIRPKTNKHFGQWPHQVAPRRPASIANGRLQLMKPRKYWGLSRNRSAISDSESGRSKEKYRSGFMPYRRNVSRNSDSYEMLLDH